MLGQIKEQVENNVMMVRGNISTYSMNLSFKLEPCTHRQSDNSPTHDIWAKGLQGHVFHAGKAWQGKTQNEGRNKYDLRIVIPELFNGEQSFIAIEDKGGFFVILPPREVEQEAA